MPTTSSNPFSPHVEEALARIQAMMRSPDPHISIRACRTLLAADLRYRMLEYTALRIEYSALKHAHTAPPPEPPQPADESGASRTAQTAPRSRPPAPPRFDELREELRLSPEHRDLVTSAFADQGREGGGLHSLPLSSTPSSDGDDPGASAPDLDQPPSVSRRSNTGPPQRSPASLLASAAGAACAISPPLRMHPAPNTT